ncbi:phosphoribosylglycinamide formyltransferase [Bacteroidia bacterium]|nr:phosphoribosylglycinamide formyltransferase [Bacteroidia bacterium]
MKKIAIFASGSGSNAENIVEFFKNSTQIKINALFCNVPNAMVLERAKKWNFPSYVFTNKEFSEADKILKQLQEVETDYIILSGFLRLIPSPIIAAFPNRILNIHPALLPKYGGKGMYGMNVHQAVIEAGETESGITIHYVNEHYDEGDAVFRARCNIVESDTPETLAAKVHALEYEHFPKVIAQVVNGDVGIWGGVGR